MQLILDNKGLLQPAETFALALAIASLPFTVPMGIKAYGDVSVEQKGTWLIQGCN